MSLTIFLNWKLLNSSSNSCIHHNLPVETGISINKEAIYDPLQIILLLFLIVHYLYAEHHILNTVSFIAHPSQTIARQKWEVDYQIEN